MIPREAMSLRPQRLPELRLARRNTALLIIDMQYSSACPDQGVCARLKALGDQVVAQYYTDRLRLITPNIRRLLDAFRSLRMEVIHTHVMSLTRDGRDRSREHKDLNIHRPPGTMEAQIIEELAPAEDEIVLSKTCGSVFNGTMIDYILRNIGIQNLVVAGVVTSGCVENTVRDAADRSYSVIVVEDACATWTPEKHQAAINAMDETSAKVKSTDEVLDMIGRLPEENRS